MLILFLKAGEHVALESVAFRVADTAFDLALMPGRTRLGRQRDDAVVLTERLHFRIDLGIEPVRLAHRGLQVVQHQRLRHAAKVMEGVLQATDELLGGLAEHRLAVGLAAMTEHDAQDVRAPLLPVAVDDRRAGAEVHLSFLARGALHAAERRRPPVGHILQRPYVAPHAVVAGQASAVRSAPAVDAVSGACAGSDAVLALNLTSTGRGIVTVLLAQILPDAHRAEPAFQSRHDRRMMRPAITHRARQRPGTRCPRRRLGLAPNSEGEPGGLGGWRRSPPVGEPRALTFQIPDGRAPGGGRF